MASVKARRRLRVLSTYAVAALATFVLASVAATQWNLAGLAAMGYEVSGSVRLTTTALDLLGTLPTYGLIIAIAMAIALSVAAGIGALLPALRGIGLVAAGVLALAGIHLIMQQVTDVSPIPAARTTGGLLAQALAGGVGGYLYYLLRRT